MKPPSERKTQRTLEGFGPGTFGLWSGSSACWAAGTLLGRLSFSFRVVAPRSWGFAAGFRLFMGG